MAAGVMGTLQEAWEVRRGLLVPVDADVVDEWSQQADDGDQEPDAPLPVPAPATDVIPVSAAEVLPGGPDEAEVTWRRLAAKRDVIAVRRENTQELRVMAAEHRMAMDDVDERAASAQRLRRERVRDADEAAALAELYRTATRAGTRARIRADIQRSAEMRALRVLMVQKSALMVGLPVLAGFAVWSTAGVQAGLVRLLALHVGEPGWWVAWLVEPLLIAIVAGVIVVRALLRSAGGDTDRRATVAEFVALGMSLALNLFGGWAPASSLGAQIGQAIAHSVGAIGAAGTAWLIGVIVDYATKARPWDGAPRLSEMDLTPPSAPSMTKIESERGPVHHGEIRKIESERSWSTRPFAPSAGAGSEGGADTEAVRMAACRTWVERARRGEALSGVELGRLFGFTARWGQKRANEARAALAREMAADVA